MAPLVSVVVPTYNEAANIGPLLAALEEAFAGVDAEFVVVDDSSRDGTADRARAASALARVIVRTGERGLATAVARGIREAKGTFVAVMDADFQHPPAAVRALFDRAVATEADLVVGSRYAAGGTEGQFGIVRRNVSRAAAGLARLALPPVRQHNIADPMSGLFLVRRERVAAADLHPQGYKILLELLARCDFRRVEEVGYVFATRRDGASKLGAKVLLQYVVHLAALGVWHPENQRAIRFIAVGLSGVVVNLTAVWLLHGVLGWDKFVALALAIEASIVSNFLLNDTFTFADRHRAPPAARFALFQLVSLAGFAVNLAVSFVLAYLLGVHYLLADAAGIVTGFSANYLYNLRYTYGERKLPRPRVWIPLVTLLAASGGLYLTGLDGIHDIYFDEHYYISVAHQMDNGVMFDPCPHDGRIDPAPVNYEHPPLAKEILWASVHAYDSYRGTFLGCRDPDKTEERADACFVKDDGEKLYSGKACYDAFTAKLRVDGNPWAWRVPSALWGMATVLFTALAARRIFRSDLAGALAGSFVLLDNLVLSSARIALLDIFATGFTAAAIYFATFPNRKGVVLTAIFLGLGFSCKYYVLFAGPPILLLSLWIHHRAGRLRRRRFDLHIVSYALLPLAVWTATYTPWFILWFRTKGFAGTLWHWVKVQGAAVSWDTGYYANGDQNHQYQSAPLEWIPMAKPMSYIGPAGPGVNTVAGYIYAMGNPVLWWSAATAVVFIAIDFVGDWLVALRRRSLGPIAFLSGLPRMRQAMAVTALLPVLTYAGFLSLNRTTFIFYMTIVVPLFALVLAGTLAYAWSRGSLGRVFVVALCTLVTLGFLWFAAVSLYIPVARGDDGTGATFYCVDVQDINQPTAVPVGSPGRCDYIAPSFHAMMRTIPWMHEYGAWTCWSGKDADPASCP